MSPETKELTVSPTSGLTPTITPEDLRLPPAVTQRAPSMQPLVQFESQLLAILSDIDATPSPVASPATAEQQSVDASPLTERALRYHRQDALRTDRNNAALVPLPSSTDPLDDFGAEMHKKDRLDRTPAPPREPLHSTIQSKIPSLGPEQNRSTSTHSLPRVHFEYNTPVTFSRVTQAVHMTKHRSFSAGLRCPPRAPSSDPPSRVSRRYAMSSSSTSSSAPKATAKGLRPSVHGTASPGLTVKPGQPQGTSSPVASSTLLVAPPSPVAPFILRGNLWLRHRPHPRPTPGLPCASEGLYGRPSRTSHPLRVPPPSLGRCRAHPQSPDNLHLLGSRGNEPRSRTSCGEHRRPSTSGSGRLRPRHGRKRACACDATAAGESGLARLHSRRPLGPPPPLRHPAALYRHGDSDGRTPPPAFAATIGAGFRPPPPARAATRPAASAASVTFLAPLRHSNDPRLPLPLYSTRLRPHLRALPHPRRLANTMPPPSPPAARAPFTTAAPWSVVAARHRRQPPLTPRDDRYLNLRLSKLMHVNSFFPADTRKPIKALASPG